MAVKKKKKNVKISSGILHIKTTSNNTHITLTDKQGNKILGGGTGSLGFKGAKKSTPYAAEQLTKSIVQEAKDSMGLQEIGVIARGTGLGRDGTFKGINDIGGVDILWIKEATGIQHGGCKGKRQKRN